MTRWDIVIPDDTDRTVRDHLYRTGSNQVDLSSFVDRAVRQAVFWDTVDSVWERNRQVSPEQAQAVADAAVAEVRARRS